EKSVWGEKDYKKKRQQASIDTSPHPSISVRSLRPSFVVTAPADGNLRLSFSSATIVVTASPLDRRALCGRARWVPQISSESNHQSLNSLLKKQISCSLQLSNKTDDYVAFKVKTTNPKKYCVRPNTGVVLPRSTCDIIVTMQTQKEAPTDMQCKDKFLVQSVMVNPGSTVKDITGEMFSKEYGKTVEECRLRVLYVSPPQPPSPVPEGSEEGSSPRPSLSENGAISASELFAASRPYSESQERPSEATALISKLTDEKNSILQQNNKLRQELDLLRREVSRQRAGGFSLMVVVLIAVLGILLGYFLKK
ncbi:hypothetical protein Taro_042647, partial [Colocasia esculenta]|nr:hypothetical protein [Colocasia esculenta]